jgi:cytochrome c oxidase subunit 1
MILPAMGVISEVISVFSRKHIFGYKFIAYSSIAIALLGFLVWGHHMFTSGQSVVVGAIFSALTFTVAIPSAIKVFNWLATLYKSDIYLYTPMCYALMFIVLFGIGGLTGLFLGAVATDIQVHDTSFVVAHFHYTMAGGALTSFFAAIHMWWPKLTGKMYPERLGQIAALVILVGFNLTYFPLFIAGSNGMPRRYWDYTELLHRNPEFAHLHLISSIGAYIFVGGMVMVAVYLIYALFNGRRAPANPWGGATLEWQTSSPPPYDNFKRPPEVGDPYDFSHLIYDESVGGYVSKQGEA